jgi:hypothetical protein
MEPPLSLRSPATDDHSETLSFRALRMPSAERQWAMARVWLFRGIRRRKENLEWAGGGDLGGDS